MADFGGHESISDYIVIPLYIFKLAKNRKTMVFKYIHLFVAIVLSSTTHQISATSEQIRNYATMLCPYNNFCQRNASKAMTNPDTVPCCADCSCLDDCWKTDNCCFDKENNIHKQSDLICESTLVRKDSTMTDNAVLDGIHKGIRRYLINENCPIDFKVEDVIEKCAVEEIKALDDMIWVSDVETGQIYKNRYCAFCHGVKNWKNWDLRTGCQDVLMANFSSIATVLLNGDCSITNEAPVDERERADAFQCYQPEFSVCNATGKWVNYDAEVEAACQAYNVPFFITHNSFYFEIYQNMFCFICNQPELIFSDKTCSLISGLKSVSGSFSGLIDFQTDARILQHVSACAWDEIHDKYKGRCKKLICPAGSSTFNGECRPLVKNTMNMGVSLEYNLRLYNGNALEFGHISLSEGDGERILNSFLKQIMFNECAYCRAWVEVERFQPINQTNRQEVNWKIGVIFLTSQKCQLETVYSTIMSALNKQVEVKINTTRFTFLVEASMSLLESVVLSKNRVYQTDIPKCLDNVAIRGLPCSAIAISQEEFTAITSTETTFSHIGFNMIHRGVSVCVDEYFSIMAKATSSVCTTRVSVTQFLGTVMALFACVHFSII